MIRRPPRSTLFPSRRSSDLVVVNGEPVKAKGIAGILFNEDGSINMDAEIEGQDGNVKVFDGSDSYEIELEATGYPSVKGTVTAQ